MLAGLGDWFIECNTDDTISDGPKMKIQFLNTVVCC